MDYQETIEFIYNRLPLFQMVGKAGYKEGIEGMKAFDEHIGSPHKSFKCIHVGGTNGKGSVSHTIASVLQSAGYKVGLFTSPHLRDFRERIRINGEMISKEYVISFVDEYKEYFDVIYPSFFEVNVAMAFKYFKEQGVDVAVIEVGLGGRLDSTNIITPELSVITNISFDHVNILGNTLESIATEKAGIIKPNVPVVIGEYLPETKPVFEEKAKSVGSKIIFAEDVTNVKSLGVCNYNDFSTQLFEINGDRVETPLLGDYQKRNMPTAWCAVHELRRVGFSISDEAIHWGFRKTVEQTHLLGRWQKIGEHPTVICDTGHNVAGIEFTSKQLQRTPHKVLRIVFGMVSDKDITHVVSLLPKDAVYYFTKASIKRAMNEEQLRSIANQFGLEGKCFPTVADALSQAINDSSADDLIYVGGSTYVVAEII